MNHETGGGFKYGVAWVIGFVSSVTFTKNLSLWNYVLIRLNSTDIKVQDDLSGGILLRDT